MNADKLAQAAQPKTLALFTADQAQALLDAFGGSPATYALIECKEGECAPLDDGSPSPAGLYIYDINCPEEGVIYLGDEDEDSEPRSEQTTQPEKPPFVLERWGFPVGSSPYRLERMPDGYWTPWHVAQQTLMETRARMLYEFDKAREQAAQPSVIAPSVQTLPLKSAPYEMTTTAQPSAIQQDNERAADSACLVLIGMGYAWTGKEWTQAKAQPSADAKCTWVQDGDCDVWETGCGHLFTLNEGTPRDNNMAFCCYCGHPVSQIAYSDDCDDAARAAEGRS